MQEVVEKAIRLVREVIEDEYRSRENANITPTAHVALLHRLYELYDRHILRKVLPEKVLLMHDEGWIYLNKMKDGGLVISYCGSIDAVKILQLGIEHNNIRSRPPKRLKSFLRQAYHVVSMLSTERTGAVGLSNWVTACAMALDRDPFYRKLTALDSDLAWEYVRECIQGFIYDVNYPSRQFCQGVFVNVDIRFGNVPQLFEKEAMIIKAHLEEMLRGDANGRPFTFPIMTFLHNDRQLKLIEEYGLSDLFWRTVAERGCMYFLNHEAVNLGEDDLYSFCCRYRSDIRKIRLHLALGEWFKLPGTGSIGYVTINMARIAWCGRREEKYMYDKLLEVLEVCRTHLMILRRIYEELHRMGMYPLTKAYIDPDNPFKYYYNTVATVATDVMCSIILGDPRLWYREVSLDGDEYAPQVINLMEGVLKFINNVLSQFEEEDGVLYNLEQSPAESAGPRLARLDWEKVPEMRPYIPRGVDPYTLREEVFYDSQITPKYCTWRLETQLYVEGKIQRLYTGGVLKMLIFHRPLPPDAVREIVETCRKMGLVYYAYTPTQSICLDCGYRTTALIWECPKCGSKNVEQWSRIVGYYRPVRYWNPGRRGEFRTRVDLSSLL